MPNSSAATTQKKALVEVYRRALLLRANLHELDEMVSSEIERVQSNLAWQQSDYIVEERRIQQKFLPNLIRFGAFFVPIVCLIVGLYLIGSVTIPIALAYWQADDQVEQLVSAIPSDKQLDTTPIMISQLITQVQASQSARRPSPKIINVALDYTNLSNWFPGAGSMPELLQSEVSEEYRLDIPNLKIENAVVAQGGTDLNKSLIAFPGTGTPGQYGAPVIFGHSVLRQFYNPSEKNPRRYTSIFSTIMTLKKGDEIFITYNGIRYTYVVQEKTEVKPTDVYILNQKYDAKRLKLVTCTPEGTYLRRGVVTAELVSETPI